MRRSFFVLLLMGSIAGAQTVGQENTTRPATAPTFVSLPAVHGDADYLLHLPGIGGLRNIDRHLMAGLRQGGIDAEIVAYDWTGDEAGLRALTDYNRNQRQAQFVADLITARARNHPGARILLSSHSGGAGIAAWALEKLPPDVSVQDVLMLAPALSPRYDLTPALRHVRGKLYVFYSPNDVLVLGTGTRLFGTIDGIKSDAAGMVGFTRPESADATAYDTKVVAMPYDKSWMKYYNYGDHIGPMSTTFGREVLAPLLTGRPVPITEVSVPTTRGSTVRTQ